MDNSNAPGVMHDVDNRTTMVGRNRLELLMFRLGARQRFGINVFKVREVIRCPPLTRLPSANPNVRGVCNMRGKTVTVVDLSRAIGGPAVDEIEQAFVIVTEFNQSVQGFLVAGVDRIVNINWESMLPPPKGTGQSSYMTAVTEVDDELVEVIDVEKVLAELTGITLAPPEELERLGRIAPGREPKVFVIDDSAVARRQITTTLDAMGIAWEVAQNGRIAYDRLQALAAEHADLTTVFDAIISDVEMPEMDGYTLTKSIKSDPRMAALHVILHTSLSGVFNNGMVKKVGADLFVPKFSATALGEAVRSRIEAQVA